MKNDNTKLAYAEGTISIVVNIVLFGLKYWAGIVSGSVAIIADAWHTLSDSITSLIVLIGAKVAAKPADTRHPFGHGRAEIIASVIIGVLLAMVGINFVIDSIDKLENHGGSGFGTVAIVVTAVSIVVKEALAQYAIYAGKKSGYRSLVADGWHHRSDAIACAFILIGIFIGQKVWWVDGVMGIIVALLIIYTALNVIFEGINPLMGRTADDELVKKLQEIGNETAGYPLQLHHVHIHEYGHHVELTMHIIIDGSLSLNKAHEMANAVEQAIRNKLGMEPTIHVEPPECAPGVVGKSEH